jgi:hypothetical protein
LEQYRLLVEQRLNRVHERAYMIVDGKKHHAGPA